MGRQLTGLVQHIVLAEPLVGRFARCFDGVDPATARELAASFAFGVCTRRAELDELLASHAL